MVFEKYLGVFVTGWRANDYYKPLCGTF